MRRARGAADPPSIVASVATAAPGAFSTARNASRGFFCATARAMRKPARSERMSLSPARKLCTILTLSPRIGRAQVNPTARLGMEQHRRQREPVLVGRAYARKPQIGFDRGAAAEQLDIRHGEAGLRPEKGRHAARKDRRRSGAEEIGLRHRDCGAVGAHQRMERSRRAAERSSASPQDGLADCRRLPADRGAARSPCRADDRPARSPTASGVAAC